MFITKRNPLLALDVYKMGHMCQYKPGTNSVYSNYCNRSNKNFDKTVFFGLQYYLKQYLSTNLTRDMGEEFIETYNDVIGECPEEIKNKIYSLCDLGYFPIEIKALDEGTLVPKNVPCFTIKETHKDFFWVVGFVESLLLKVWYPSVVSTASLEYRKLVEKFFDMSVENKDFLKDFMVHDFGYRGDSSEEGAAISGAAHLLNFTGSDTIPALKFSKEFYGADTKNLMKSVPASEHSIACSYGRNGEREYIENMLDTYPTGIVSIVSDQYDVYTFLNTYVREFRDKILNRDGKTVFRPDSGDQYHVICGYSCFNSRQLSEQVKKVIKYPPINSYGENFKYKTEAVKTSDNKYIRVSDGKELTKLEVQGCLRVLENIFGSYTNKKGYKVLNEKIGLIYGDGLYLEKYERIQNRIMQMGFSAENLVIGVGGILRNYTRDTTGVAIKATNVEINGERFEIFKDPITDSKGKKSAKGLLKVEKIRGSHGEALVLREQVSPEEEKEGELKPVFRNGEILKDHLFEDIKKRVSKNHVSTM